MQFIISSALRRPLTVMVLVLALVAGSFLAVGGAVFEQLGLPYPQGLPRGSRGPSTRMSSESPSSACVDGTMP